MEVKHLPASGRLRLSHIIGLATATGLLYGVVVFKVPCAVDEEQESAMVMWKDTCRAM